MAGKLEVVPRVLLRNNERLILASASPRRRQLLAALGIVCDIVPAAITEEIKEAETPRDLVVRLAMEKAKRVSSLYPGIWVAGADTAVVLNNEIIGKPADAREARMILKRLAGRRHDVWTGFCLCLDGGAAIAKGAVVTGVHFAALTDEMIAAYVRTGEPLDKAGAYGIQGMGGCLVQGIEGSYTNVVGLPLAEVVAAMLDAGVVVPAG